MKWIKKSSEGKKKKKKFPIRFIRVCAINLLTDISLTITFYARLHSCGINSSHLSYTRYLNHKIWKLHRKRMRNEKKKKKIKNVWTFSFIKKKKQKKKNCSKFVLLWRMWKKLESEGIDRDLEIPKRMTRSILWFY